MTDENVVASMMPKKAVKKKAAPKKKAVAKKKAAVKKKPAVKKKAVKKSTPRKRLNTSVEVSGVEVEAKSAVESAPLPQVNMPGEFQRVEHPPMGVKDQDREAAVFLIVISVIAALILAMAFGV